MISQHFLVILLSLQHVRLRDAMTLSSTASPSYAKPAAGCWGHKAAPSPSTPNLLIRMTYKH